MGMGKLRYRKFLLIDLKFCTPSNKDSPFSSHFASWKPSSYLCHYNIFVEGTSVVLRLLCMIIQPCVGGYNYPGDAWGHVMLRIQLRLLSLLGMHSTILNYFPDSASDLDDSISTITGTINYLFSLPLTLKSICVTVWMRIPSPHLFSFSQTISHSLIYSSRDGLPSTFQLIWHGDGGVTTISSRPGFKLLRL